MGEDYGYDFFGQEEFFDGFDGGYDGFDGFDAPPAPQAAERQPAVAPDTPPSPAGRNAREEHPDAAAGQDKGYSTPDDMLRSGAIMQAYGRNDMVSVNLAPEIHMVRWSVVRLRTGGRDHLDFYMKMDDMRRLCREITDRIAPKRIQSDNGDYPSAYKFSGGKEGCRNLNIGKGRNGVCVQVRVKSDSGQWNNRMVAVPYEKLSDMAFYFGIVTGLTPCSRYYKGLADAFWEGVEDRAKRHGGR